MWRPIVICSRRILQNVKLKFRPRQLRQLRFKFCHPLISSILYHNIRILVGLYYTVNNSVAHISNHYHNPASRATENSSLTKVYIITNRYFISISSGLSNTFDPWHVRCSTLVSDTNILKYVIFINYYQCWCVGVFAK